MNALTPYLTLRRRCEARATLDALPYPQSREAEVLLLIGLATRLARGVASDFPGGPLCDRMDALADRLEEVAP